MVKYSVITSDKELLLQKTHIADWLGHGIKVVCFSESAVLDNFGDDFEKFKSIKLLQLYSVKGQYPIITIVDGQMDEVQLKSLEALSTANSQFNLEQYLVEHGDPDRSLIIEASAGTGKTTVMIDRILYLINTVPGLSLADIAMITFTNEATQNMRHKVQEALLERFKVTSNPKYAIFLEDESKMRTHTIHSFSKSLISELGPSIGYGNDLILRSFKYEKKQIIRDVLDEMISKTKGQVVECFGLKLHELENLIFDFWTNFENVGLTDEEILSLDWGNPNDESSATLHETLVETFLKLNEKYNLLKRDSNAISIGDIVRELRRILEEGNEPILKSKPIKYLFVDEFQDSDNAQIKTIIWLKQAWKFKLFAVGDIKQSIYRFRGAIATAFERLKNGLKEAGDDVPVEYKLIKNYRTSEDILRPLDKIFRNWASNGLLCYDTTLSAQKSIKGDFELKPVLPYNNVIESKSIEVIRSCLDDCCQVMIKE